MSTGKGSCRFVGERIVSVLSSNTFTSTLHRISVPCSTPVLYHNRKVNSRTSNPSPKSDIIFLRVHVFPTGPFQRPITVAFTLTGIVCLTIR